MNQFDIIDQFRAAMLDAGIKYDGTIIPDAGKTQYFHADGDKANTKKGWYTLHTDNIPSGSFGHYKSGIVVYWSADVKRDLTQEERKLIAERIEKSNKEREEAEKKRHAEAAEQAAIVWDAAEDATSHPYLSRKQVKSFGLKVGKWPVGDSVIENALLLPIKDGKKLVSLQAIFQDSNNIYKRDKTYLSGGKKKGCHLIIGEINKEEKSPIIALCEGYSTGASIHMATGWPVVVAFDAGNIQEIARKIRSQLKNCRMVICADNDQWTHEPIENPGVHYAKLAAKENNAILFVPEFTDLKTKPTDCNDLHVLHGIEILKNNLLGIFDVAEKPYFTPLGYDRGRYYFFLNRQKQIHDMSKSDMTTSGLLELAPMDWWKATEHVSKTGIDTVSAADFLINSCIMRGIFSHNRMRGRGAWSDQDRFIFHFGDVISVDGALMDVTSVKSRYIYEQSPALIDMPNESLSLDEAENIFNLAGQFRWTRSASQPLLAGWIVIAPFCGALNWRPHIWITGGAGCGKSTIIEKYVSHLLGDMKEYIQGNSTEAGIRQKLKSDAIPVIFDEAEQNNEREQMRVQNILSLIRQASSESGAKTLKGTASGDAMDFLIRSTFLLSSIQVGIKHQADHERLTVLSLKPSSENENVATQWEKLKNDLHILNKDKRIAARLFKRSFDMFPSIMKNIELCVQICTEKFNSAREGDQIGTLLGGALSLLSDETPSIEFIRDWIDTFNFDEYREHADTDESTKALTALLESRVRSNHGEMTIYAAIEKYKFNPEDCNYILSGYGMKVQNNRLYLANNSSSLNELMKNTPYAADLKGQLIRIKGAQKEPPMKFAGYTSRSVSIPLSIIID